MVQLLLLELEWLRRPSTRNPLDLKEPIPIVLYIISLLRIEECFSPSFFCCCQSYLNKLLVATFLCSALAYYGEAQSGGGSTRLPRTVYREILAIRDTLVHFDCSLGSTPPRRARGYMMSIYLIVKPPGWVTFSLGEVLL